MRKKFGYMAKDEKITLWREKYTLKGRMIEVDEFFIRNGKRYMSGYCIAKDAEAAREKILFTLKAMV